LAGTIIFKGAAKLKALGVEPVIYAGAIADIANR
jgi:hypothetical protein